MIKCKVPYFNFNKIPVEMGQNNLNFQLERSRKLMFLFDVSMKIIVLDLGPEFAHH